MLEPSNHDEHKPELQLEYAGAGPGGTARTAIGLGDGNPSMDPTVLPPAPWWFTIMQPYFVLKYMDYFQSQTLPNALAILEGAEVPPLYRLGLGLRWHLLSKETDDFGVEDFAEILSEFELLRGQISAELDRIEKRSTFQLWRKYKSNLPSFYLDQTELDRRIDERRKILQDHDHQR